MSAQVSPRGGRLDTEHMARTGEIRTICPRCERPETAGHKCHWYDRLLVTRGEEAPWQPAETGERKMVPYGKR